MPSTPKGYWQDQVKTQLSEDITEPTPDQPFIHIAEQSNQSLLKIMESRGKYHAPPPMSRVKQKLALTELSLSPTWSQLRYIYST